MTSKIDKLYPDSPRKKGRGPKSIKSERRRYNRHHRSANVWDFPGVPAVKNLPCNAGHMGSIDGWITEIPHATEKISLPVTTTAPVQLS